jgi:hypothetical protein
LRFFSIAAMITASFRATAVFARLFTTFPFADALFLNLL